MERKEKYPEGLISAIGSGYLMAHLFGFIAITILVIAIGCGIGIYMVVTETYSVITYYIF